MSEELIKSLNGRIAELEKSKLNLEVALRGERKDAKALKAEMDALKGTSSADSETLRKQVDELTKDRDGWQQKATAAPTEQAARIAELEAAMRTRDHRDAFRDAVGNELGEGWSVDDLWHFGQFDPSKVDTLDANQINELVGKVKEARPGMFARPDAGGNPANAQGAQKPPFKVATDASRGARDTASGQVRYSRADIAKPGWMTSNPALKKAFDDGTAVLIDG